MKRQPPRSTRTYTLFPYTTLFRSAAQPAQFSKKISIELVGGLSGDDVDDATDGIFSVERSLRATQHFDALDVEKRRVGLSRLRKIGAVQVDRHTRVGCQILVRLARSEEHTSELQTIMRKSYAAFSFKK